jgi:hypothetical protein
VTPGGGEKCGGEEHVVPERGEEHEVITAEKEHECYI